MEFRRPSEGWRWCACRRSVTWHAQWEGGPRMTTSTSIWRHGLAAAACLGTATVCSPAAAFHTLGSTWPGGNAHFSINANSFTTNLPNTSLTSAQALYWIGFALGTWHDRAGGFIAAAYDGLSTRTLPDSCRLSGDGNSDVYASAGCFDGNCLTWGRTEPTWADEEHQFYSENDICIYGGAIGPDPIN